MKSNSQTRKPRPAETETVYVLTAPTAPESMDITVDLGTLKYCKVEKGWLLPAGNSQVNRVVRCPKMAKRFAFALDLQIKRNLSMKSLNSRLIAYGRG